tara:strand:- start:486 stop:758 length:273 start_codon:yes stop_codon:yes gene_type:complete
MEEIIKKAISDSVRETVMQARENSVFTDEGRIFLDASASLYGAAVNNDGLIIDENGNVMTDKDPNYQIIINTAKKQARAQSALGSDLLGS